MISPTRAASGLAQIAVESPGTPESHQVAELPSEPDLAEPDLDASLRNERSRARGYRCILQNVLQNAAHSGDLFGQRASESAE
jgi:hypothetical protein